MDTLLQIVVSIGMYVLIFVAVGVLFYAVDKRVKAWLRRPVQCRGCSTEIAAGTEGVVRGLCPACARKRRPSRSVR
ncbi:MAG: hypothetical protein ACREQ5_22845 [Candidatus Dormibacteria bacterium]